MKTKHCCSLLTIAVAVILAACSDDGEPVSAKPEEYQQAGDAIGEGVLNVHKKIDQNSGAAGESD